MKSSRREYLRRQRRRRRRVFYLGCLIFFIIVAVLLGILISRIRSTQSLPSDETSQAPAPAESISSDTSSGAYANSSAPAAQDSENSVSLIRVPLGYELRQMTEAELHEGNLILVNKSYEYVFPDDLQLTDMYDLAMQSGGYSVSGIDVRMQPEAAQAMDAMLTDFYYATGLDSLYIMCSYRSREESQELFDASVAENGLEHAQMYVMLPGFSEHHSALAADLGIILEDGSYMNFVNEGSYSWIKEHCAEYGFILRYPEDKVDITEIGYESWHFRYLGVPNATAVSATGLCYEEYIDFIKNYRAEGDHYAVTTADGSYEIYYAPGLQIAVPSDRPYEISGNNVDGFIITVSVDG